MQDPLSWMPVKYKLAASYVAICLMAFGVGGYLISTSAHQSLKREIAERLRWQATAQVAALSARLELLGRRTQDFASDGFIRESVERILRSNGRDGRVAAALEKHLLENKLPLEEAFVNLMILNRDGASLARARAGTPPADAGGQERGELWFGPMDLSEGGDPVFAITTPLWNLARSERLGTLVVAIDVRRWIASAPKQGRGDASEGMLLTMTDPAGNEIVISAATGAEDRPTITSRVGGALRSPDLLHDADGRFSHESRIALNDWRLRVDLDARREFEPVSALQSRFIVAGFMVVAAALILVFFPMRFLVLPLTELRAAARRIAEGDFSVRLPIKSSDEIGDLSRSFNVMAEAVEERTNRLVETAADLKRRQEDLSVERDRLKTVVHSMDDGLILLDERGEIEMANASAAPLVTLLQSDHAAGVHPHRCESAATRDCLLCLRIADTPTRTCLVDIGSSVFEILSTTLGAESGRRGRVLVARDVTEFVTLDERQAHRERLAVLGEIAAVMAHELNNPLAAISMYGQMMERGAAPESPWKEHIEVIRRNTDLCKQTIRGLLDYAAGATPEPEEFDLHELLHDLARFLRPILEKAGVRIVWGLESRDPVINGVEMHIRQIFVNLIINAAQAMDGLERPGEIRIVSSDGEGAVLVEVRDHGPGVAPDLKERIFEPFFTSKPAGVGTGLGLSTARRIAESIGGSLRLAKTEPGQTTFQVLLPRTARSTTWRDLDAAGKEAAA